MEDNLKIIRNGRRPQKKNGRQPQKKWEKMNTTSKKIYLFLIPLKFRGKPFLGLAQLSKIFFVYMNTNDWPIVLCRSETKDFDNLAN